MYKRTVDDKFRTTAGFSADPLGQSRIEAENTHQARTKHRLPLQKEGGICAPERWLMVAISPQVALGNTTCRSPNFDRRRGRAFRAEFPLLLPPRSSSHLALRVLGAIPAFEMRSRTACPHLRV
jgi:hypothetical protein